MGNRIRELRRAKGWTQQALAAHLGVHLSTVSKMEVGTIDIAAKHLHAISEALDVPISELLDEPAGFGFAENAEPYLPPPAHPLAMWMKPPYGLVRMKDNSLDQLHISAGDVLVFKNDKDIEKRLDMGRIVVCQVMSGTSLAGGTTIVREFIEPNLLITNSTGENAQPIRLTSRDPKPSLDGREVHLRGIVETSIRVNDIEDKR